MNTFLLLFLFLLALPMTFGLTVAGSKKLFYCDRITGYINKTVCPCVKDWQTDSKILIGVRMLPIREEIQ